MSSLLPSLPVTVAAYEDEQEPPAGATVAPAASAVSDAAWAALTKRVSDLEASNAELRTTISQLSEMVSTLRGGGGYGSYAPSPEKQVVGAAARHLAASRAAQLAPAATVVAPERDDAPTSTHNGKPAAGEPLPAAGVDLRAAIARKAHQTPNYALPAVTGEADASTPMMSCPRAAPFSAIDSPTAPPANLADALRGRSSAGRRGRSLRPAARALGELQRPARHTPAPPWGRERLFAQ